MAIQTVEEMELDLGEKLKRLRLNKNLDQKTLAARAGVSVRALRNLEGGEGTTVRTLLSVVRALGRESWLQTVAPVPTINPATFTTRAASRLRAASPRADFKLNAAERLLSTAVDSSKVKTLEKKKRDNGQDE
ncbi:helix-turn-helix transcriptional regulator [Paraburkholderia sp. EG287A]|uniref:helix-turn-helix transcriptional regulator n=1 Tax=Paraburkholderia sp. EG287A TaxID=3237012 RepID=UPI0034D27E6D